MTYNFSDIQDRLNRLTESEVPFVLATVIRTANATSAKAGAKAIIEDDGEIIGWLGGGCVQHSVRDAAKKVLRDGRPQLIKILPKAQTPVGSKDDATPLYRSSCPSGGSVEIFLEPVLPRPQLVICGGSPIARALADLGRWLGFSVIACAMADDLAGFEAVDHRVEGFDLSDLPLAVERYLVVATQGKRDKDALKSALAVEARYTAFVGSREKGKALRAALLRDGVEGERLRSLRNPAGLDIGGAGAQEIALSVLAEIVQIRRTGIAKPAEESNSSSQSEKDKERQSVA